MLKASPKILKTVKVIYTEVNTLPLYEGAILYAEFKNWIDGGDVLFVRK